MKRGNVIEMHKHAGEFLRTMTVSCDEAKDLSKASETYAAESR